MKAVDELDITILVDNSTDNLSSAPRFVENEFAALGRRGLKLSGKCLCCAAHGLSCLITAHEGATIAHAAVRHRAGRLGVRAQCRPARRRHRGRRGDRVVARPLGSRRSDGPRSANDRGAQRGPGSPRLHAPGYVLLESIEDAGRDNVPNGRRPGRRGSLCRSRRTSIVTTQEQSILGDSFVREREIPRVTAFERGLRGQHRLNSEGFWEPDELTKEERFVAVDVAGKDLVLFTACSHAGLINVAARQLAGDSRRSRSYVVLGGFHLAVVMRSP